MTRRAFTALAAHSALALAGCTDRGLPPPRFFGAGATTPRRGGTLTFSLPWDISSLDPASVLPGYNPASVFDTLLDYAPAHTPDPTEIVPSLADRWGCSADGMTYTFHLREGASFSNGEPVVAEDFVYAIDRLLSPEVACGYAGSLSSILGAQDRRAGKAGHTVGLRAVDPATLEIRLDQPDPIFPHRLTMPQTTPLKKRHVEAVGPHIRDRTLGTGPFMVREWKEGRRIVYERNPRYWNNARPSVDCIVVDLQLPADIAALKFLRGEQDVLFWLSLSENVRFAADRAWRPYVDRTVQMVTTGLMMNTQQRPFTDKRVRQAMNYAINKEDLVRIKHGRMVIANGYLPPAMPGHNPHRKPYPYDPDKARRLLAEAGYADGFDIEYCFIKPEHADPFTESIQADLAAVGIRMSINYIATASFLGAYSRRELVFSYYEWWMDFPDPSNFLEERFHSRNAAGGWNGCLYSNPEFDRLLDEARRTLDREKRLGLYRRAEDILFDDCPDVWIGFPIWTEVRQPYVMGYKYHPVRFNDYCDTWLDGPRREAS